MNIPFIEKYRPRYINDILLNTNIKNKIQTYVKQKEIPNILINGSPGIGKTTTIKCIARELYGPYMDSTVLELNASDDRGIQTVQDIITTFCKKKIFYKDDDLELYAHHKLIILDEADNMTEKAQIQINILMEEFNKTTRFVFTCNESNKIIETIQNKCILLRYSKLDKLQIKNRLIYICQKEKIEYNDKTIDDITTLADGDGRTAINSLQLVYNAYNTLQNIDVFSICGKPQPQMILSLFSYCKNKDITNCIKIIYEFKNMGLSELEIVLSLINYIKTDNVTNEKIKIKYLTILGNKAYVISNGIETMIQLVGCICDMIQVI